MRVLVFGAGAIGSLVGGLLSRENETVLLCRKAHADAINRNGLVISGLENIRVCPCAEHRIRHLDFKPDLIILTVKAYDTGIASRAIKKAFGDDIPVLTLQNGLENVAILSSILGKNRVICGLTSHGVTAKGPGLVHHSGRGDTVFGEIDGRKSERLFAMTRMFRKAGISVRITDNIEGETWAKAIVNAGINPLTAITGRENGYLLKCPHLKRTLGLACTEGVAVAHSLGIRLPSGDMAAKAVAVARTTAGNRSSMLQDIDNGRMTEVDYITGTIVRAGRLAHVPTPVNEMLLGLIHDLEKRPGTC